MRTAASPVRKSTPERNDRPISAQAFSPFFLLMCACTPKPYPMPNIMSMRKKTPERRGAELHFADTPEKGDVGHADELLEQEAQHQRNGHAEDGAARIDAAAFDFEGHVQKD